MATTSLTTYTAKLTDGPLEGKTITTEFLPSGDPRPRLEITAAGGGKRYLYIRVSGTDTEYASADANADRPSAVGYRYRETLFD
ncbi:MULTISPECIES: hypothetical protein [Leifsonia]|jgi:hypothetical protein|uniref:Uncharacterized protein n=3 Tax=Leifsonia TaxID=110932 RepID=U2RAU1_LEIAQ|nr:MULTISPECIES: hypothetical protein [Leifsonia]ERK72360.1 hypothetical protein N136_01284 [Leifsonia aquatica ATCC 14665]MBB2965319.1 hypothetical protein [Leifsonia aquatica]NYK08870.1 hypothetical protein [Leifsonia naganoensis]